MKLKKVESKMNTDKISMNLQIFSEGYGVSVSDGKDSGSGTGEESKNGSETNDTKAATFDEFLKEPTNQAEFDRRVQKAIQTAVGNAQKKWKALTNNRLPETEKLSQMTREERAEYKAKKLENELNEMKKKNSFTEMAKIARRLLADEQIYIPDELMVHMIFDNFEDTKKSVDSFVKLFRETVHSAVKEEMQSGLPTGRSVGTRVTKEQIVAIKEPTERHRLIARNIILFQ